VRVLASIAALLSAMEGVVTVEARADGLSVPAGWRWLGFAALWAGMRPAPFAHLGRTPQPGAWALIGWGCLLGFLGLTLAFLAWVVWHHGRPSLSAEAACVLVTVLLLAGLSLLLHFGIFNVLAGLWRLAGVDARSLFRAPLAARSLENFRAGCAYRRAAAQRWRRCLSET
jgi:alginate O-acetyltransferase complex protein AlgI